MVSFSSSSVKIKNSDNIYSTYTIPGKSTLTVGIKLKDNDVQPEGQQLTWGDDPIQYYHAPASFVVTPSEVVVANG
jgi:hypothetical protein